MSEQLRTIKQINERIATGDVVVLTAEELAAAVEEDGLEKTARRVDVVTTGTFGPMCSSGAFINFGHATPRLRASKAWLNDVPAYAGIAAVDVFIGATELAEDDPTNKVFPGRFEYGGAHVIHDLLTGKKVTLRAVSYGTDCYPGRSLIKELTLDQLPNAWLYNPRNCYQNYPAAVNLSAKTIYTYMGILKPDAGNINFSSAGALSPMLKDPEYRTIGLGTKIFLGGGVGWVVGHGTQHNPQVERTAGGAPKNGAGTLALQGDLKGMSADWLRPTSLLGYGVSMTMGVGIPIPIIDQAICGQAAATDSELLTQIVDYSEDYPNGQAKDLAEVSYAELYSGQVEFREKTVPTASMSSRPKAREIAALLKDWIATGNFTLGEAQQLLPR
ncbi:MAG: homocysteine biosynthesis protein [Candidatus Alcyoniella australis]|nr:homocysteine biosynthesis protein [Candidatus Alcyoniella australis]